MSLFNCVPLFKNNENEQVLIVVQNENTGLNEQVQNKYAELKKLNQKNQSLNEELERAVDDLNKANDLLRQRDDNLEDLKHKLNGKNEEVGQLLDL